MYSYRIFQFVVYIFILFKFIVLFLFLSKRLKSWRWRNNSMKLVRCKNDNTKCCAKRCLRGSHVRNTRKSSRSVKRIAFESSPTLAHNTSRASTTCSKSKRYFIYIIILLRSIKCLCWFENRAIRLRFWVFKPTGRIFFYLGGRRFFPVLKITNITLQKLLPANKSWPLTRGSNCQILRNI